MLPPLQVSTVSMEKLINFRSLCDQLTETEYVFFLEQIIAIPDVKKAINQAIFALFKQSPNKIQPFTNLISHIIQGRKNKKNKTPSKTTRFGQLPSPLISECASYLKMREYLNLSKCNRRTYVSLYQKPRLTQCILTNNCWLMQHPQWYSLSVFRNCQTLTIDTETFNQKLTWKNQSIWKNNNKLNALSLQNYKGMALFLERNLIYTDNLNKLVLTNITCDHETYTQSAGSFVNVLSRFLMITTLALSNIQFSHVTNQNPFISWQSNMKICFKNLRVLHLGKNLNVHLCDALLNAFGEQLTAISLPQDCNVPTLSNEWENLEELVLKLPTSSTFNNFFANNDKCINLKRSMIIMGNWQCLYDWMTNMIHKQLGLQLMCIWCNDLMIQGAMEKIELLILQNKRIKRKSTEFTVKLLCILCDQKAMDNLFMNIFRLFEALESVESWLDIRLILVFEAQHKINMELNETKYLLNQLDAKKHEYVIECGYAEPELFNYGAKYSFRIVISNKGCKINGYPILQTSGCELW